MNSLDPSPQEEELEALRSIYGTDWEDLPPQKTAWNIKGEEGWWTVILRGADERVSVKLKGRFTKLYPSAAPILSIEEPKGLTSDHVHTLNKIINDKAKFFSSRKDPAPYIFDINDCVIDWISNNHVPLPKIGEKIPTLMEEMAQREEAQRAAEIKHSQAQKEEQRAREEEQNRLLNEKIQLDTSRKAQKASQAMQDEAERKRQEALSSLQDGELEMRELHLDSPISIDGYDGAWSSWVLFGGKKEPLWTSYTAEADGGDVGYVKASLPSVCVQVVDFSAPFYSTAQGRKRVDAVAVEVARLREVSCENVTRVYAVKREKSPKGWERLIVVTEKTEGGKVKTWMPREGFGEDVAREYITQLLSGLSSVHRIGATQKQIDPNTVLLTPASGDMLVKLSGTGYARRLADLNRSNQFLKSHEDTIPDSWLSPDEIDSPYTYTSKRDIWHVGVLLVQLLFGVQALWRYPNLHILLQHTPGVSDSMTELLNGLLHANSKKRFATEEALSKARVVDEVTRRDHRTSTGPMAITGADGSMHSPRAMLGTSPNQLTYFPSNPLQTQRHSRYREDFEEVEFLGKGGFGEVVKARNKIDGRAYAIKKVKLRPEDNELKVYREVNNLSRVSHQHIVRYHACWIENITHEPAAEENSDTPTPTASITEEASDPFAINFDDISRRDQSRSASFPRIRFGNADDSDDDDSDSDESSTDSDESDETAADPSDLRERGRSQGARPGMPVPAHARPSSSVTGTTTDDDSARSILYIQMEFVEKQTLREAITAGLEAEEVWRLLGQILQALAHMSSLGIVHRDLKPSNILLDASGNVKIADFGLSTTELTAVEVAAASDGEAEYSDRTSGIGTSLYIAPEVAISRSYNEKADMYSLGVIFFEMCFAFKTNMERVYILNALRQPSVTFPQAWSKDVKPNEREIVEWLLRHDPATRPSAQQLLSSPLLPSREKQKEFYDSAIAELTNPRSDHYPSLLNALFDPQAHFHGSFETRTDDFTYDNEHSHDDQLQIWLTVVLQRLVDLLQRHGAVETYIPLFIPETLLLQAFPDLTPVRLLDSNGKIVQLPSSDLLCMARSATRREIERIKRYHVGHRYADHAAGGQPTSVSEMSFDIISPLRSFVAEAELLDVVDKIISEFRGVKESIMAEYEFHVSHETVLASILNAVPEKARSAVLRALKAIPVGNVSATRAMFSGIAGLPKHIQDDLEQCCIVDDFVAVRRKLESLFPNSKRRMAPGLDALGTIVGLARACGVTRRIMFRPTLSKNAEFFRGGFMFECVRRGKQRELIAFGGRYDSLLEHFKAPSQASRRKVYGVGMSINVEQLARMVRKHESGVAKRLMDLERIEERSFGYWSPARCDVYVASVSQIDLATRLSIVGELWRAGIKADLQYDDDRTIEMLELECIEQNTLFIVIPRHSRDGLKCKIKNVLKGGKETECARAEVCGELRHALAEQRRVDAQHAEKAGSIPLVQTVGYSAGPLEGVKISRAAGEPEVRLVLPPELGKAQVKRGEKVKVMRSYLRGSKTFFTEKAAEFANMTGSPLPILACDLSANLLSELTSDTSWLNDDDHWRTVQSRVFGEDRKYLDSVREAAREGIRNKGWGGAGGGVGSSAGGGMGGIGGVGMVGGIGGLGGMGGIGGGENGWGGGGAGGGWIWLFSVREARGFLLQPQPQK